MRKETLMSRRLSSGPVNCKVCGRPAKNKWANTIHMARAHGIHGDEPEPQTLEQPHAHEEVPSTATSTVVAPRPSSLPPMTSGLDHCPHCGGTLKCFETAAWLIKQSQQENGG